MNFFLFYAKIFLEDDKYGNTKHGNQHVGTLWRKFNQKGIYY